ncbi:hypothetical protein N7462_003859 [Penicillium macrosclerotiorum]|uniref:uncharacterized protein n=1 Tax=Penicillium macrosclerotiorum TaxID=303699 RepID=UPI002546F8C2|nr:uncharacterized protein N7462_003859 [Penicillium macrosclerotiorum]KAJ5689467.1 hypothetical protein N7462_003859 [Penicillium macrosclerotiorum]
MLRSCCHIPANPSEEPTNNHFPADTFTSIGTSIIQLSYIDGVALYCCGTPISSDNGTICPFGKDSFQLDDADMIPGRAGLADYVLASNSSSSSSSNSSASNSATTSSSTSSIASSTTTPSTSSGDTTSSFSPSSHDAALGAGLGIPLGVIAIASVVWALWERRRANSLSRAMMGSSAPASRSRFPGSHAKTDSSVPTELDNGRNVAELMT